MSRLIDVYPYCRRGKNVEFLLFKRSEEVIYAGQWRMIGGKVEKGETASEAALRELREESGLQPKLFWAVPSVNQFYDHHTDTVKKIPAFAAEVDRESEIELNHEHLDYRWVSDDKAEEYISWPEQLRLIRQISNLVTGNKILDDWII